MSIRTAFVSRFGEVEAYRLEAAAAEHSNEVNSRDKGPDPFKWVLLICIGYDCFLKERFRTYHEITTPAEELKDWIKEHGELGSHVGDCDYLSLFCDNYREYIQ